MPSWRAKVGSMIDLLFDRPAVLELRSPLEEAKGEVLLHLDLPRCLQLDSVHAHPGRADEVRIGHASRDVGALIEVRSRPAANLVAADDEPRRRHAQTTTIDEPRLVDQLPLVHFCRRRKWIRSEDAVAAPAAEPAVGGGVVAQLLGQSVPLAAAAQAEDDGVEHAPPVGPGPAGRLGRGVGQQDRLDPPPEFVGDLPDGVERLGGRHPWPPAGRGEPTVLPDHPPAAQEGFGIVT